MTDIAVEFIGGPLDGTISSIRAMTTGRPPRDFAMDVIAIGGGHASHSYQAAEAPNSQGRWPYEYVGIRPR